ncbi:recombinase family protein [Streptomyces sp. NPDC088182]|uniref:recombinase family protein n=1 Tax=Streptomyces sp. NPDC088182 TaxID=3365838 RepID=UPI00382EB794
MRKPACVIYVRLSRDSDASTSVASQTAACEEYAARNGWRVLFIADDVDVSGASRLENRKGMARVLDALDEADFVIAAKLDRYARSVLEFSRLLRATDDCDATLVTADGALNPDTSRFMVNLLSSFAEYERDVIKARITASKKHLRTVGRWLGGAAPYGYKLIKRDGGTYLDIDPDAAAILRDCAEKLTRHGTSLTSLMRDLNARGVPSPADHARKRDGRKTRGAKWSTTTLRDVLITPAARGFLVQAAQGKPRSALYLVPVLDAKGEPHRVGPELFDADTWTTVREAIDRRAVGRGKTRTGKALLLHVAACSECSGPMYHQKRMVKERDYSTYVCPNGVGKDGIHASNVIQASGLDGQVESAFLARFGRFHLMTEVASGGQDVSREIHETEQALDNLSGNLASLPAGGRAAQTVIGQIAALEEKLEALLKVDAVPLRTEWVRSDQTITDEWTVRETEGRNAMLREFGAVVTVAPLAKSAERRFSVGRSVVTVEGPAWVMDDPAAAELAAIAAVESEHQKAA